MTGFEKDEEKAFAMFVNKRKQREALEFFKAEARAYLTGERKWEIECPGCDQEWALAGGKGTYKKAGCDWCGLEYEVIYP